jgi:hypothetical protein
MALFAAAARFAPVPAPALVVNVTVCVPVKVRDELDWTSAIGIVAIASWHTIPELVCTGPARDRVETATARYCIVPLIPLHGVSTFVGIKGVVSNAAEQGIVTDPVINCVVVLISEMEITFRGNAHCDAR